MEPTLENSMQDAWLSRAAREANFVRAAVTAPALFKPEAVQQARDDFARAKHFAGVWG